MKLKISLILLLCASITQFTFGQKISIGPEVGANIIPLESTDLGTDYKIGMFGGAAFKYKFNDKFGLRSGLYISQKKKNYASSSTSSLLTSLDEMLGLGSMLGDSVSLDSLIDIPGVNMDVNEEIKGNVSQLFIEIPVLASYKLKDFNFYLGPYVGVLLSARRREEITTTTPFLQTFDISEFDETGLFSAFLPPAEQTVSDERTGTDGLNILDFGASAGIGYEADKVNFNLIYSRGFMDYRDDRKDEDLEVHQTIRFTVSYLFDLQGDDKLKPQYDLETK